MSQYYNPHRVRNVYNGESAPFRISRSKIDLFLNCPRCFYLDVRLGVARPPGFPFSLNSAVDTLLKKEFDIHRAKGTAHPLMKKYKIDAVPLAHEKLSEWRHNFTGVSYFDEATNFEIFGAVDDLWSAQNGDIIIVDYKATSKDEEVSLDADWQIGYKRQMEVYQWLFKKNGFSVSPVGYFVYCNGKKDREAFDGKLEFDISVIPYEGDDSWVDETICNIKETLDGGTIPEAGKACDYCAYRKAAAEKSA